MTQSVGHFGLDEEDEVEEAICSLVVPTIESSVQIGIYCKLNITSRSKVSAFLNQKHSIRCFNKAVRRLLTTERSRLQNSTLVLTVWSLYDACICVDFLTCGKSY